MNYFEWFGIEESFRLDLAELKRKFYQRSMEVHPDRNSETLELSSHNNEAYNTLRDEIKRWKYLLDTHTTGDQDESLPQLFLMEMMDLNEKMSDLLLTDEPAARHEVLSEIESFRQEAYKEIDAILKLSPHDLTLEQWDTLHVFLLKQKYFDRLEARIL